MLCTARHDSSTLNSYSLVAHTGNVNILLANGQSFEHSLRINQAEYYTFANLHWNGTVVISITPIQGDPGLYVSGYSYALGPRGVTRPNATHFDYQSNNAGGDMIVIRHAQAPVYYIGVRSVDGQPARYTILVQSYDPVSLNLNPVALSNGRSVPGFADYFEYRHYYYTLRNENVSKLTFFALKRLGDPDLYINHPDNGTYPNTTHAYSGRHRVGLGQRRPQFAIPGRRHVARGAPCSRPTSSTGMPEPSQYVLTMLEGGSTLQMSDGQPFQSDLLGEEYDYYSFYVLPQTNVSEVHSAVCDGDVVRRRHRHVVLDDGTPMPLWYNGTLEERQRRRHGQRADRPDPVPGTTYYCSAYGYTRRQVRHDHVARCTHPADGRCAIPACSSRWAARSTTATSSATSSASSSPSACDPPRAAPTSSCPTPAPCRRWTTSPTATGGARRSSPTPLRPSESAADACSLAAGRRPVAGALPVPPSWCGCRPTAPNWDAVYSITVEGASAPTTMEYGVNYDAYVLRGDGQVLPVLHQRAEACAGRCR